MKWTFVDYENVGSLDNLNLSHYQQIIVFVGVKQSYPRCSYLKAINFTFIKIAEEGKNNLDFHLAYYLADYNQIAQEGITFEVISNDKGFAPLIKHINLNIRSCTQIFWQRKNNANIKPKRVKVDKVKTSHLVDNLAYLSRRPKTFTDLYNQFYAYSCGANE